MIGETISVIIPCYNAEETIERSIRSVCEQHCAERIELIIVDDGSTDSSAEKIKVSTPTDFLKMGNAFKYVFQENKGLGGAVNCGLKYVTGEYLTLLDADDEFLQGSFSRRAEYLDRNPDFVGVRTNGYFDCHGERSLFDRDPERNTNTDLFGGLIGGAATNWAGSYMIRTDALFAFYPDREIYPSRFGQNMQLLLPVSYKNKFGYIDEPYMVYYLRDDSHSRVSTESERLEKERRNLYGYNDIYKHMIDLVVKDVAEHDRYMNIVDSWVFGYEMRAAIRERELAKMKIYFEKYRKTGLMSLNEKIDYYSVINPPLAIILRFVRRLRLPLAKRKRTTK